MSIRDPESGQTTVVMTLFLATFLFGFIALGIDVEALFHAKRQAQAAADAAAVAAAEEWPSIPNETAAAKAVAKMNGFDSGILINPAVVTVHQIPTSGNYTTSGTGNYLEVIVSQPIRTFFAGMVTHNTTMTIGARAVGVPVLPPMSCVCLEGTGGTDLNLSNAAHMNPAGCGITVNSAASNAVTIVGGAVLGGLSIGSVSTNWDTGANVNNGGSVAAGTTVVQGIPAACSPPVPPPPPASEYTTGPGGNCTGNPPGSASYSVGPGSPNGNTQSGSVICYTSLTVGANGQAVNLNAGTYIINGGTLEFMSGANGVSNTGGDPILIYLVNGAKLTIDNGANVNLKAATSGAYSGVVILQDSGDSSPITIAGGASMIMNGTIFAPTADVNLSNGSNSTVGASLIAKTLTMTGGTTLSSMPITGLGAIVSTKARLVE